MKNNDLYAHGNSGMTLRDYFAAKVMQATIAGTASDQGAMKAAQRDYAKFVETTVEASYAMADAMLAERNK